MKSRPIGHVAGLWRYPVKSMAGEPLTEVEVSWHGLVGDRRWAFVRNDVPRSGFPWLTLRERSDMSHYRPSFVEPGRPDQSDVVVHPPSGDALDVADPALGRALYPAGARAIKQDRGVFDTFPLSLITTRTIAQLGETVGTPLDTRRFRPNILVDPAEPLPYLEDGWVGAVLQVGEMLMRVDKRDGRCVVITIDPETSQRNPAVLRTVAEQRDGCLGVYGSTVKPGRVSVGDPILLIGPDV